MSDESAVTETPVVRYQLSDGAAVLTLDSPHNRNAISDRLLAELQAGLDRAAGDPDVRAVVLTHTGGTFCAGADLKSITAGSTPQSRTLAMLAAMRGLIECPKPVIARIDGHVRAGGFGLIGSCDFVYAGPASTFALTETRIGVAPAMVSLVVLPHLPSRVASDLLLTGRKFDGAEAARHGLITAATQDVDAAVAAQLDVLWQCSPQGLAETKTLLWHDVLTSFDVRAAALAEQSARLFGTPESVEGITAFLQKRPPSWARRGSD
jgi:enoyl-CoA hydratase